MSNQGFTKVGADHLRTFFDESGAPRPSARCPECGHTQFFKMVLSTGKVVQFSADCGHRFELKTP
jgi:DNA-directed RNA polymerase subunit RPC12/RpoP